MEILSNIEGNVSKAEFIAMIVNVLDIDMDRSIYRNAFEDVNSNTKYCDYIQAAKDWLLIDRKMADENLFPNDLITRQEVASILVNAYNLNATKIVVEADLLGFEDISAAAIWAKRYIEVAVKLNLMTGINDIEFAPEANIKADNANAIIKNFLNIMQSTDTSVATLYNSDNYIKPIWEGSTIYDERVLPVSVDGNLPVCKLLFNADKIISVKNSALNVEYQQGRDWILQDGVLKFPEESIIPYMVDKEFFHKKLFKFWSMPVEEHNEDAGGLLFQEGKYFYLRQLSVTYEHTDSWNGPVPTYAGDLLPKTMYKLKNGLPIKITLYGDSISAGSGATAKFNCTPNSPNYIGHLYDKLKKTYKSDITLSNPSVGGKLSSWGVENVNTLVSMDKPDFVIIAFGMNDGTHNVSAKDFKANIEYIMNEIRKQNPDCEFILISTIHANTKCFLEGTQSDFIAVLNELKCVGVAIDDMTAMHDYLLNFKEYLDMSSNNTNHPNDFIHRWYAQTLAKMLIEN